MNVNVIDEKIKRILKKDLNQEDLLSLMFLIEKKLNKIFEHLDLLPFSSLIQKLNLSENQKIKIIHYRNKLAHNIVSQDELAEIKFYLTSEFLPFILTISSDSKQIKQYEFESLIYDKLKRFGDLLGYNVIRNELKSIDNKKKTKLEIDVVFESDSESILFEIKASSKKNMISVWIDQLKARLKIYGSKYGVLVIKNLFYEEICEDDYKILIIGELLMHKLLDWIMKIKVRQKENKPM